VEPGRGVTRQDSAELATAGAIEELVGFPLRRELISLSPRLHSSEGNH